MLRHHILVMDPCVVPHEAVTTSGTAHEEAHLTTESGATPQSATTRHDIPTAMMALLVAPDTPATSPAPRPGADTHTGKGRRPMHSDGASRRLKVRLMVPHMVLPLLYLLQSAPRTCCPQLRACCLH